MGNFCMHGWTWGVDLPWHHFYDMIITSQLEFIRTWIEIQTIIIRMEILEMKFGIRKKIWGNIGIEMEIWNLPQLVWGQNFHYFSNEGILTTDCSLKCLATKPKCRTCFQGIFTPGDQLKCFQGIFTPGDQRKESRDPMLWAHSGMNGATWMYFDGLVQERCKSSALAMDPSICSIITVWSSPRCLIDFDIICHTKNLWIYSYELYWYKYIQLTYYDTYNEICND